jgi:hypothetical protein
MGMGLISDELRALVRRILRLPEDPGQPPDLVRLGLYRARVDVCDGSTVDVSPEDPRISPEKGVPLLVPIPGAVVNVSPGAIVHLGWEKGDPSRPYCTPIWEAGATLVSLSIGTSADAVVTASDIAAIKAAISGAAFVAQDGGKALQSNIIAAWPTSVGSSSVKVQR